MTAPESQTDRIVRVALAAARANLVVQAVRQYVAEDHHSPGCDCHLCAALARYDRSPREVT